MCELLGMNCNVPTDICFSFEGFHKRGGGTAEHTDGWGIAFFEGRGCRVFLDYRPSLHSPIADLVRQYPIKSTNVIAHIRKATVGKVELVNTQPFMRELWGHYWLFAHNGDLKNLPEIGKTYFRPVGSTDSERAFCWILESLRRQFAEPPALNALAKAIRTVTQEIAQYGTFNYMLSNGEYLFTHCSTHLHYIIRQAPFAQAHLIDEDLTVDFSEVTTPHDRVAVIATHPLTDNEVWTAMYGYQFLVFQDGLPVTE